MAYYNKIGVLITNEENTRFLVCEKHPQNVTADYIMPGGQFHEATVEECIKNEIREELGVDVDLTELEQVGTYVDVAAGKPERDVEIRLYRGVKLLDVPSPQTEIKALHWIGRQDQHNEKVSPIIRNKIIPDLVHRTLLK